MFFFSFKISSHLILSSPLQFTDLQSFDFPSFKTQLRHLLHGAFPGCLRHHDFKVPTAYVTNLQLGSITWVIFKLSIDHLSRMLFKQWMMNRIRCPENLIINFFTYTPNHGLLLTVIALLFTLFTSLQWPFNNIYYLHKGYEILSTMVILVDYKDGCIHLYRRKRSPLNWEIIFQLSG